ncbi:hypothetical protein [Rosistilla oblonga]|uniref:hypothetical protein n=1 Tax=Rosistilla oblonga TaxID=2527990 RepID=UPI003A98590E
MLHSPAATPSADGLIEIGVIIAGPLDDVDRQSASWAIEQTRRDLSEMMPEFRFRMLQSRRPELASEGRTQPSVLLQQAAEERDARHWDFVIVCTASDLVGNYAPFCFAALSRPLDAAVISLSLIDPPAIHDNAETKARIRAIAHRTSRLMLHAIGHLNGLSGQESPQNLMFRPATAEEIDAMQELEPPQIDAMHDAMAEIADQRLEESTSRPASRIAFLVRAAWINRREIAQAVIGARPWQFPRHLSRLTIAAVSTVAILLMTAEAWDLGLSQTAGEVATLALASLILTTIYVVFRQQLLVRRGRQHTEQTVVTSTSALAIVLLGMSVTWIVLMVIGVSFSWLLFDGDLIAAWAGSNEIRAGEIGLATFVRMSGFSASLGLLIGALGASFESQHYFRHIIFVDEEI